MVSRSPFLICLLATTLSIAGCGGGSGAVPAEISEAQVARFLRQATFGPTRADMDRVMEIGYADWIDEQLAMAPTLQQPILTALNAANDETGQAERIEAWLQTALTAPDQLRQRVAFALSEILVVSEISGLFNQPYGLADYYDHLVRNAFGNYRTLMEDVTLSPAMGVYLSMLGNQKPNPALNIRPDENYARELMQLFTIGLVELDLDGTVKLDNQGQPIPSYTQDIIEGFAHVYTGWTFGGSPTFFQPSFDYQQPMQAFANFHDTGAKMVLSNVTIPAGQTPEQDLDDALDNIFSHPNVAPFIARQLIQKLTASNPSPQYVRRVAMVFEDNGRAVRGDLAAVVRAVLLDAEARASANDERDGKVVEPLIRLTALWRAFGAQAQNGRYQFPFVDFFTQQAPLRAPHVFNFFLPQYAPPGEIKQLGLVAPEMEIINELSGALGYNLFTFAIFFWNSENTGLNPEDIFIDISEEMAVADDVNTLVDLIADKLLGGAISAELRAETVAMVNLYAATNPALASARVAEAIHMIANSPEYAILR